MHTENTNYIWFEHFRRSRHSRLSTLKTLMVSRLSGAKDYHSLPRTFQPITFRWLGRTNLIEGIGTDKHDLRNHTKPHQMEALIRVTSCHFVDRFTAFIAAHQSFSNLPDACR